MLLYIKKITKNYDIAVGIRYDEMNRYKKKEHYIYPLITDFITTKNMVNEFWDKQQFKLEIKNYMGNCDLCWKKSKRKLLTILKNNPEIANWWAEMELKYSEHVPISQINSRITPISFFRNNESTMDLLDESNDNFKEFKEKMNTSDWQLYLDFSDGCTDSCEII